LPYHGPASAGGAVGAGKAAFGRFPCGGAGPGGCRSRRDTGEIIFSAPTREFCAEVSGSDNRVVASPAHFIGPSIPSDHKMRHYMLCDRGDAVALWDGRRGVRAREAKV